MSLVLREKSNSNSEQEKDWDTEGLRHMGTTSVFKENAPDGYKEHIDYVDGDSKVNTGQDKLDEWDDIKA